MSILRLILLFATTLTPALPLPAHAAAAPAAAAVDVALAQAAPPPPTTPTPPPPTATQPAGADDAASLALTVVAGLVLIALAAPGVFLTGAYRRDSIRGPLRLPPGSPVLPILLILIIGGGCWLGGQMLFFVIRGIQHARATGGEQMTMQHLGAGDMAMVATLPSLLALLIVLALDARFGLVRAIGLRLTTQLPRTLLIAFIAGVIALLLTYGASSLLGVFYKLIEYEHPSEHELLGAMKEASTWAKLMLVFGACVMAPLFEELLFRGHMQTLLTRLFTPRPPEPAPAMVMPAAMPPMETMPPKSAPAATATRLTPPSSATEMLPIPPLPPAFVTAPWPAPPSELSPIPYASPPAIGDRPVARWLAVIITSVVFAIIHPLWTAPMIFLLSLCLGYAYERTGSLWVPIIMHAMFNTTSTVMFLLFM